jgi:DNA-3-methyladenine glycosylase II
VTVVPAFSVDEALEHLRRVDPLLGRVIDHVGEYRLTHRADPYAALLRTIMFQQLSGASATAIQRRLFAFHGDEARPPAPEQLLAMSEEQFRGVGVSRQKAGYLRDLALNIVEGRLDLAELPELDDEEVTTRLVAVKGLGEWSAHMFLMFNLQRPDVLPVGDLGVRHGMKVAYGLADMPTPAQARKIGAKWAPYRSVGSWYMWRVNEANAPFV